ncbi:MAG: hypothetical protein IT456_26060 [Planctomycetes bacterium]|nr:hypothetical protein [Planctomycetota bacterium]
MEPSDKSRDSGGRFRPGNAGGPGRRPEQASEKLRRAVEEAISPDHLAAVMRRVLRQALEGNMTAVRILLERTCGRPAQAPTSGVSVSIDLPSLRSVADCTLAIDRLAQGICDGTVDREAAQVLLDVIQVRLKAIELSDLEGRLAELEEAAKSVELGPRRRGGRR